MHAAFVAILLIIGILLVVFTIAMFAAIFTVTGEISKDEEQRYIRYMCTGSIEDKKYDPKESTKQERVEVSNDSKQAN
jgi:flagellar basal body-associated protein FliL